MVFGVKLSFCGGTRQSAEMSGVFPSSCCEDLPPIPHPTVPRGSPVSPITETLDVKRRLQLADHHPDERIAGLGIAFQAA